MRDKLATLWALGPQNLARVGLYRLGLKSGLHPVLRIQAAPAEGPFFAPTDKVRTNLDPSHIPDRWQSESSYFSHYHMPLNGPPDWHSNPFQPGTRANSTQRWNKLGDFDPAVGDIKTVWEASRFDWVVAMAQRIAAGDMSELDRLNDWLSDWNQANPPYHGLNWKCGQEASIRVMHLALAALLLGQSTSALNGLQALIALHLTRIAPTMGYAKGQANNHGTSESAALFIGGSWLANLGDPRGQKWMRRGRAGLEERARVLIMPDGTFSQYSVVYHRLMLDTYNLTEIWRQHHALPEFSSDLLKRLRSATHWLHAMSDPVTGDAPNLGANDGAQITILSNAGYRDFRPSIQMGTRLFYDARAIDPSGIWDQPAAWLGLGSGPEKTTPPPSSITLDDGGFHILRQRDVLAVLRYPRFRFRPSQADALHLDFWVKGQNLLRDAGSYSYNSTPEDLRYFSGTEAHNTVQFDGRDQMPRLGRFLFGNWLQTRSVTPITQHDGKASAAAEYQDSKGARHNRQIHLEAGTLHVTDTVSGFEHSAVLRWRLAPGEYQLTGNKLTGNGITVTLSADVPIKRLALVSGSESRFYLQKDNLPVLEAELQRSGIFETRIEF